MPTQKKKDIVQNFAEKLEKVKAFFLADYRGLTHHKLEELRKSIKETQAEFTIVKNKLFALSLDKAKIDKKALDELKKTLVNPTAVLFSYGDTIKTIKALSQFITSTDLPKIKSGLFEQRIISEEEFKTLAALPSRETLLATLTVRLNSPIQAFHYALNWNMQKLVVALNHIKNKK